MTSISNLKFKSEFDKILAFFTLHAGLFFCAKIYEYIRYEFSLISFIGFIIWCIFYRFYYRTIRFLYYSFWTMAGISIFAICTDMFSALQRYGDVSLFYFYFLSIVTLAFAMYFLYSPIFYPNVSWWEYDFRYRNDINTMVKVNDEDEKEGRLIDLRRGHGGLSFFGQLEVGDKIVLKPEYNELDKEFRVEVMSKRQHSIGRPYTYGLKFHFDSSEEQKDFVKFQKFWQFERKHKKLSKFKHGIS